MEELAAFLKNPYTWIGIGLAAILGVWRWGMTPQTANLTLVIGVVAFAVMPWLHPVTAEAPILVRMFWSLLVVSIGGPVIYQTLCKRRPPRARFRM